MPWRVIITARAQRELDRLPRGDRLAVIEALDALPANFGAAAVKKLGGRTREWRLRVGRWRVIMELDNRSGVMTVTHVRPRPSAYRDQATLNQSADESRSRTTHGSSACNRDHEDFTWA
jgi:mRNA interferase RelE/StbE